MAILTIMVRITNNNASLTRRALLSITIMAIPTTIITIITLMAIQTRMAILTVMGRTNQ